MPTRPKRQFAIEREFAPQHGEHQVLARAYACLVPLTQRLPGGALSPIMRLNAR